jgi:hypothetical protein
MKNIKKTIILSAVTLLIQGQALAKLGVDVINDTGKKIEVRIDDLKGWVPVSKNIVYVDTNSGPRRIYWREHEAGQDKKKPLYSTWETFSMPHTITIKDIGISEKTKKPYSTYDIVSGILKKQKSNQEAYVLSEKPGTESAEKLFEAYKTSAEYDKKLAEERK